MYNERFVQPIRQDLVEAGFEELRTPEEVHSAFQGRKGPLLCVVNSICGCAAAAARPGVKLALDQIADSYRPKHLVTVFAGQDKDATATAREYFVGYPPSSPSVALLRDGEIQFLLERHDIEGSSYQEIAEKLTTAFQEHFGETGADSV